MNKLKERRQSRWAVFFETEGSGLEACWRSVRMFMMVLTGKGNRHKKQSILWTWTVRNMRRWALGGAIRRCAEDTGRDTLWMEFAKQEEYRQLVPLRPKNTVSGNELRKVQNALWNNSGCLWTYPVAGKWSLIWWICLSYHPVEDLRNGRDAFKRWQRFCI